MVCVYIKKFNLMNYIIDNGNTVCFQFYDYRGKYIEFAIRLIIIIIIA